MLTSKMRMNESGDDGGHVLDNRMGMENINLRMSCGGEVRLEALQIDGSGRVLCSKGCPHDVKDLKIAVTRQIIRRRPGLLEIISRLARPVGVAPRDRQIAWRLAAFGGLLLCILFLELAQLNFERDAARFLGRDWPLMPFVGACCAGVLVMLGVLALGERKGRRARIASLLEPDSGWRLAGSSRLERETDGLPVSITMQDEITGEHGKTTPPQTTFRFRLPVPATAKLALRETDDSWLRRDLGDWWSGLVLTDAIALGAFKLYGSPTEEARETLNRWIRLGFEEWVRSLERGLHLTFAWLRLEDSSLEIHFKGEISESEFEPRLKDRLEKILRDCRHWMLG